MINLRSKFVGCLVGSALGDAIGELAFSHITVPTLRARIAQLATLTYTDDTAMTLGLAESLIQLGVVDEQALGDIFRKNYRHEPNRGYAIGPPTIFSRVEQESISYVTAAQELFDGEGSYGNGAAMRIAPLGLLFYDSPDLNDWARRSAMVTHAHPIGIDGAVVLASAISQVVTLDPRQQFPLGNFAQRLMTVAHTPEMQEALGLVHNMLDTGVESWSVGMRVGQGVAAHKSVPFAIYAFLRHPQSFVECLFCAVLNAGDRDTVGAMAGALSGAYLGFENLPQNWFSR
ncbi:MAG: ADP-ribosylglycohydrolase family protein, partial [Anaerolineae bacterium]|nr:ADP-ribosylglycohydrolase family protein [Anaerolineae bacterium]